MSNTQLTSPVNYDTKKMIFDIKKTKDSTRVNISTYNKDGTKGDLIFPTTELFTFGVQESKDFKTQEPNGKYVLPLCLHEREQPPSKEEQAFIDTINNVVEEAKNFLIKNKQEIGKHELIKSDLRKLNPLYYKKVKDADKNPVFDEQGNVKLVEGEPPVLYAKLIQKYKKKDKDNKNEKKETIILSTFYDENGEQLNPLEIEGKRGRAKAAVKVESIFVGANISMQLKLYEADIKILNTNMTRLLPRPKPSDRILSAKSDNPMEEVGNVENEDNSDGDSSDGSIAADSESEEDQEIKAPPNKTPKKKAAKPKAVKKVPKKVVRNVVRKKKATK